MDLFPLAVQAHVAPLLYIASLITYLDPLWDPGFIQGGQREICNVNGTPRGRIGQEAVVGNNTCDKEARFKSPPTTVGILRSCAMNCGHFS